eukprot:GHVH01009539.1.p1 GENE.GHVH01009539.1~~GHVH01009539.1.p1  ORF type:complete len:186 (+),score=18.56 GHVH01009539.1:674-1231(+)
MPTLMNQTGQLNIVELSDGAQRNAQAPAISAPRFTYGSIQEVIPESQKFCLLLASLTDNKLPVNTRAYRTIDLINKYYGLMTNEGSLQLKESDILPLMSALQRPFIDEEVHMQDFWELFKRATDENRVDMIILPPVELEEYVSLHTKPRPPRRKAKAKAKAKAGTQVVVSTVEVAKAPFTKGFRG